MDPVDVSELKHAGELIAQASRIVIFSGAGMSAESGVPTFRGPEGLWKNFRPEQLATPQAFAADARTVWEWYDWRRTLIRECQPNAGHVAVAQAQCGGHARIDVLTQNVDGLHAHALARVTEASGATPQGEVSELHGSLFRVRCSYCSYGRPDRDSIDASTFETLPRCPDCDALLRPGVVWFGESLDGAVIDSAFDNASRADVCIVVGTSGVVEPAASLPRQTKASGGRVIEINLETTPLSAVADVVLLGPSAQWLPRLFAEAEPVR